MSPRIAAVAVLALAISFQVLAQKAPLRDPTDISLEDLMDVQVTSVSKKEQKLSRAGAAIFVITQEDIRRSGATGIPDLLRMVPGVSVAQVDGNNWAISIRGFGAVYANKVLVLIDGRSVYSPTFSGVLWDQQDVPLETIERIEVIRGPGGTVWGANAVNGVINILTKSAKATPGSLVTAGGGSQGAAQGLVQHGGAIGGKSAYRVFGSFSNFESLRDENGRDAADGWHKAHLGFRSDWELTPRDSLTVIGDLFHSAGSGTIATVISAEQFRQATIVDHTHADNANLLGRWNHTFSNGSDMSLQIYLDHNRLLSVGAEGIRNTVDFDFQHRLSLGSRHDIVWGGGYRVAADNLGPGYSNHFDPARRTDSLFSTFVQDEIRIANSISFTLGSKFEHNAYTGFEVEPGAQIVWTVTPRDTIWASAAQAIRQPSRVDTGVEANAYSFPIEGGGVGVVRLVRGDIRQSERVRDYEAGYRTQIHRKFSVDLTGFSSFYRSLQTTEQGIPFFEAAPGPTHLVVPLLFGYDAHSHNYGAELSASWNLTNRWRLTPSYSLLRVNPAVNAGETDPTVAIQADNTPRHQYRIRSYFNLTRRLELDFSLAHASSLADGNIPSYTRLDTRLGWRIGESLEIGISGQNLLSARHLEFPDVLGIGTIHSEIPRRVFAKLTWRF